MRGITYVQSPFVLCGFYMQALKQADDFEQRDLEEIFTKHIYHEILQC